MLYSILIHGSEAAFETQRPEETEALLARHFELQQELKAQGRLGPVLRMVPHVAATAKRNAAGDFRVTDGSPAPWAAQLMALYVVECATPDDAVAVARRLAFDTAVFEIRPVSWFDPGTIEASVPGRNSTG